jgi:outer membrane protein OmpA-like peptidoglycan-associated protein/uncharacterized protein YidB (DUF937 family)
MGTLDAVLLETSRLGLSPSKAGTLLSGFLNIINDQAGGLAGLLDRFRRIGLGDTVASWVSGASRAIPVESVEKVLGTQTVQSLAQKSGLSVVATSSALAFMIPKVIQRLAPGGVTPSHLPSDVMSYVTEPASPIVSGTKQSVPSTERTLDSNGLPRFFWPLLVLVAILLFGIFLWNDGDSTTSVAPNVEQQVRQARQKASSALNSLRPGFTMQELLGALNFEIIKFSTGSVEIPADDLDFLNKAAVALKTDPSGSVLEIGGHTDNSGDAGGNMRLSQQRADAVRNYLVSRGVSPEKLIAKGYGDTQPVASNEVEEGKFHNRRIAFTAAN